MTKAGVGGAIAAALISLPALLASEVPKVEVNGMATGEATEASADDEGTKLAWTVPINVLVSQLVKLGKMPVQFALGASD